MGKGGEERKEGGEGEDRKEGRMSKATCTYFHALYCKRYTRWINGLGTRLSATIQHTFPYFWSHIRIERSCLCFHVLTMLTVLNAL